MGWRTLSREAAMTLMELAGKYHEGKLKLPPEIIAKKQEIKEATRKAELFMIRLREVDHGLINRVVNLKLELDALWGKFAESETAKSAHIF